ncbi:MAG: NAD(+) diphosphatase [Oscillospiraceae bacterium]|nr:NAD(+) diphosphatase [Oscillospiraceae bacterium]MBP3699469.1 NAD(+) diphosphatase [Oscillospiraceae bacterium]
MIQDIAPHRLDRRYDTRPAADGDIALCYQKGTVLLEVVGEDYALPRFGKQLPVSDARHLFELDGDDCFMVTNPPAEAPEGCRYVPYMELRAVRPQEVAFAAITGAQLHRWYGSRKFCGRCGQKMQPSDIERAMVCPDCGLIEYPKICPAVIVAVINGDKLMVTRYADRPFRGWALIAGFVEIGETLEDTVRREVMEEVGVKVKNLRYYKNQPWSFTDTLLCGFYCDLDGDDTVTLDTSELKEAHWLSREELPPRQNEASLTAEMMERFRLGEEC